MSKKPKPTKSEIVRRVLEDLERKNGRNVKPRDLVNAARSPSHPLHNDFEWDDSKAAEKHREDTARRIITTVRIKFEIEDREIRSVRYVRDPALDANEQGFVSVRRLISEEENALLAIDAELARIVSAIERAQEVAAALDLSEELDRLLAAVLELKGRSRKGRTVRRDDDRPGDQPTA